MHHEVIAIAWPYLLIGVTFGASFLLRGPYRITALASGASLLLVAPTSQALAEYGSLPYEMWAVLLGLGVLGVAFKWKPVSESVAAQIVAVLVGLVNILFAPAVMCLSNCFEKDGLKMLTDALETLGQIHDTDFVFLSIPMGTAMGLVGLGYLFSRDASRKAAYRLLEVAGLLNFFGLLTLLSLPHCDEEFFYISLLIFGGLIVMALGVWGRRAMFVSIASVALLLNLIVQYFAKLSQLGAPTGLLAVGFGIGLLLLAVIWEQKVKALLPRLKSWA